jgi:translin
MISQPAGFAKRSPALSNRFGCRLYWRYNREEASPPTGDAYQEFKVPDLVQIVESIRAEFSEKNHVRDATLNRSRELIRLCSLGIRAIHRHEWEGATALLASAREAASVMIDAVAAYGDLNEAGYTQDALKELVEAHVLYAFVRNQDLPGPADLGVPAAAYLNGLAEAASELRRFVLDLIRLGETAQGEPYLALMDEVYSHLITIDFPDALTGGLRRTTDMLRGVLERTRGDLTVAVRQEELQAALSAFDSKVLATPAPGAEG